MTKKTTKCPKPLSDSLESMLNNEVEYVLDLSNYFTDDYKYSREFLLMFSGSAATFNSYRREVERLLQWCNIKLGISLKDLRRADFELYLSFCKKPPKSWISTKKYLSLLIKIIKDIQTKTGVLLLLLIAKLK